MSLNVKQVELWEINRQTGRRFLLYTVGRASLTSTKLTEAQEKRRHTVDVMLYIARDQKYGWMSGDPGEKNKNYEILGRGYRDETYSEMELSA